MPGGSIGNDETMAELVIDFITSLDGYGAGDDWPGWWGLEGPEYLAWLGEAPEGDYTILMGANTYRLMSGFAADGEPGTDALADMPKIVFSNTLREPDNEEKSPPWNQTMTGRLPPSRTPGVQMFKPRQSSLTVVGSVQDSNRPRIGEAGCGAMCG